MTVLEEHLRGNLSEAAVMLWDYQPPKLTPGHQEELFRLAIEAIETFIDRGEIPEYRSNDPVFTRKAGVFVTLRIRGMLRGCIGHMSAEKPLVQAVQEMAVAAATSDPRFPPMTSRELQQITMKIAILSPMQRITPEQVEIGKHGVLISYFGQRGVLLPEVASERGWDRETFLENVCLKAGLTKRNLASESRNICVLIRCIWERIADYIIWTFLFPRARSQKLRGVPCNATRYWQLLSPRRDVFAQGSDFP